MGSMSLEDFVGIYIDAVSETIERNHLFNLDDFYEHVYATVSDKTGFSREEIVSLHHPFHWVLFLEKASPLEFFNTGKKENNCGIRIVKKITSLKRTELTSHILEKYRTLLQQKLNNVLNHTY